MRLTKVGSLLKKSCATACLQAVPSWIRENTACKQAVAHIDGYSSLFQQPASAARGTSLSRRGLSLLEVILAMAILAGAITVLGELVRMGLRHAAAAQDLTRAQLLCESKMAEITAVTILPEPVRGATVLTDPDWRYSIEFAQTDVQYLVAVRVTVERDTERRNKARFSLVRWMPDPGVELSETSEETPAEETPAEEETTTGTTSGGDDE